jgi:hypothetical protein
LSIEYGFSTALERAAVRRWEHAFIDDIAADVGFTSEWHDPFISAEGLETYGAGR